MAPEPDREQIAGDRDRSHHAVDQQIQTHACQHNPWETQARSDTKDHRTDQVGQRIADAGNKSNQWVQSYVPRYPGNPDRRVQCLRKNISDLDKCSRALSRGTWDPELEFTTLRKVQ